MNSIKAVILVASLIGLGSCNQDDSDNTACFSPTQNLEIANDADAEGCDCNSEVDEDICIDGVALVCEEGKWQSVEDGPCFNPPIQQFSNQLEFQKSLELWNELKTENGTSYMYEVNFSSFSRFSSTTKITVVNNIVVARSFESFGIEDAELLAYEENEDNLGENEVGAMVATIDELYTTCLQEVLVVNKEGNDVIFSVSDIGLLRTCVYIPKGCQDDCSRGVSISNFSWMQ